MRTFRIGSDSEHVKLEVPAAYDSEGRGRGHVEVLVPGFRAEIDVLFNTGNFERFLTELECLQERLTGTAKLHLLEDQLSLVLEGNGAGEISMTGTTTSDSRHNRLAFVIALDQSFLARPIHDLRKLLTP